MKSPFPGMDPYLEAPWGDVHHRLTQYAADHIQTVLPPDLRSRVEERVFMESWEGPVRPAPDVRIIERPGAGEIAPPAGTLTLTQPLVLEFPSEEITEGFIETRESGDGARVVTIIEVVSRSNKYAGEGRRNYLEKQRECHSGEVNLVEIDLLRAGQRVFRFLQEALPEQNRTPYQIVVWRADQPDRYEFYAATLQDRLPIIAIPLREADDDAPLDLQTLLEEAYQKGRYDDLDYSGPPTPRSTSEDESWADVLLREKGLRS